MDTQAAPLALRPNRVHDVVGVSAPAFAALRAAQTKGPVIWIEGGAGRDRLYPQGLAALFDPERLISVAAPKPKQALWCMEEALRETPALVVASLPSPTDLLQSRRLQLAAEAGGSTGICLVPEAQVNNAAETRWRSSPLPCARAASEKADAGFPCESAKNKQSKALFRVADHGNGFGDSTLHKWELIKNKKGILGSWDICWNATTHNLSVVAVSGGGARLAQRRDDRFVSPVRGGRDAEQRLAALLDQRGG